MANTHFPELPQIPDTDLVLDVYTHHSLSPLENDRYGDPRRLATLGQRVLDQAIVYHFFKKSPFCSPGELEQVLQIGLPDTVELMRVYNLRGKIRSQPDVDIDTTDEARVFWSKYIGALYLTSGFAVVQDWISRVLDPNDPPPSLPGEKPAQTQTQSGTGNGQGSFGFNTQPHPLPPSGSPPPVPPPYYPPSNGNAIPPPPGAIQILASFNQMAQQKNMQVTYPARSEGAHHTPTWFVQCCVNNEVKGEGTGRNQKQAKEMAARQAWTALGWGHLPM